MLRAGLKQAMVNSSPLDHNRPQGPDNFAAIPLGIFVLLYIFVIKIKKSAEYDVKIPNNIYNDYY